jgi:Lysyl oxidase
MQRAASVRRGRASVRWGEQGRAVGLVSIATALTVVAALVATGSPADATAPPGVTSVTAPQPVAADPPTDVGPAPLLPDLRARKASEVHIVVQGSTRRLLFASTLANIGVGPLQVERRGGAKCPAGQRRVDQAIYQDRNGNGRFNRAKDTKKVFRQSGCEIVTAGEDIWHVQHSARYWLTRAGHTKVIVRHPKVSFCLRDSLRLPSGTGSAFYPHCSRDGRKGISVEWGDLYQSFLPGQSLLLPNRVKGHAYCLWQQADPKDMFRETDETNNTSVRAVHISRYNNVRYLADNKRCR